MGIIVRSPPVCILELYGCRRDEENAVYIFESTVSEGGGVLLSPLVDRLACWAGCYGVTDEAHERRTWAVCTRAPLDAAAGGAAALDDAALHEWIRESHGHEYGITAADLRKLCKYYLTEKLDRSSPASAEENEKAQRELQSLFCTECAAESLMRAGALERNYPPNLHMPLSFLAPTASDPGPLPFSIDANAAPGVRFGPLVRIVSGCADLTHDQGSSG